ISNNRIVKLEDGLVTFKWRDYKDSNKQKEMSVTADEFTRRFLIHVLPTGLTRIRHYGLLSPRNKATKLKLCKKLTNTKLNDPPKPKLTTLDFLKKLTGKDFTICPCCGIGHLGRASPEQVIA
ncbi:transposase, partial [Paenibacillus sp. Soil522]